MKYFLFLAFVSFALVACSEDPEPAYHAACSKSTRNCLVGIWKLQNVENGGGACNWDNRNDQLTLKEDGDFEFEDGINDKIISGEWSLSEDEKKINIKCMIDCNGAIPTNFSTDIKVTAKELRVTAPGYASFSQCYIGGSDRLTELFFWEGPIKK